MTWSRFRRRRIGSHRSPTPSRACSPGLRIPSILDANLAAILAGDLPAADRQRLRDVFGPLDEPIGD